MEEEENVSRSLAPSLFRQIWRKNGIWLKAYGKRQGREHFPLRLKPFALSL
jgi:hypothetical protein